jgi:hypothetical protein
MNNFKKLAAALLILACPAFAQEPAGRTLKGVTFPTQVSRGGKTLQLNGIGLRTKVVFKVYVAALYAEKASKDDLAMASSVQDKVIELVFLRGVDGKAISEAISGGFEKNSKEQLPALSARLEKLRGLIPDLKKGDKISFAYSSGKGVLVEVNGAEKGFIEGGDFADALFLCWLGHAPADSALKKGLLGE